MNLPEPLRSLPDSARCYIPGVGEVTVGDVRATARDALADDVAATLRVYAHKATRNLLRDAWANTGAGRPDGKA